MGGGTGTGAAPVIAQLAREEDILVVGVATKPFLFEGKQRARRAESGLDLFNDNVDTLVTIPNEKLLALDDEDLSFVEAFRKADEVLYQAVKGISDLITQSGMVNVDFADVRTVMSDMGRALMGTGCAKGEGRARLAAELAVTSPLLDDISVDGAMGVLINVVGGPDMKMREVSEAATLIQEQAHEDANIIFGATIDENMGDAIKVTVIATGFQCETEIEVIDETAAAIVALEDQEAVMELARRSSRAVTMPATQRTAAPQRSPAPHRSATPQRPAPQRTTTRPRLERVERVAAREAVAAREVDDTMAHETEPVSEGSRYREREERMRTRTERESRYLAPRDGDIDWDTPAYQRRSK
jgi:cell division protein FtsZ